MDLKFPVWRTNGIRPLLRSITKFTWFLNLTFQHRNEESVGICRIAIPISAVFAVQPSNSAEYPPEILNSWSTAFLQNIDISIVPLIRSSSLAKEVPVPIACGTDPFSWCRRMVNSLIMILGRIECRKLITKNVYLC